MNLLRNNISRLLDHSCKLQQDPFTSTSCCLKTNSEFLIEIRDKTPSAEPSLISEPSSCVTSQDSSDDDPSVELDQCFDYNRNTWIFFSNERPSSPQLLDMEQEQTRRPSSDGPSQWLDTEQMQMRRSSSELAMKSREPLVVSCQPITQAITCPRCVPETSDDYTLISIEEREDYFNNCSCAMYDRIMNARSKNQREKHSSPSTSDRITTKRRQNCPDEKVVIENVPESSKSKWEPEEEIFCLEI